MGDNESAGTRGGTVKINIFRSSVGGGVGVWNGVGALSWEKLGRVGRGGGGTEASRRAGSHGGGADIFFAALSGIE